jgi:O-antigen/teichoic acid export membrane protein
MPSEIVNLIRLPMGVFTFLGPVLVAIFLEPRLDWIAWALVAGRWIACLAHAWYAWRALPQDHGLLRFRVTEIRPLLSIGGWLTVSNIVSPLMGYADRFIIAGLVSAARRWRITRRPTRSSPSSGSFPAR